MLRLSANPYEESLSIPELFVRYLKASSWTDQLAIVHANPLLFTDDIVAALRDARVQIDKTAREVKEACRVIDAVSGTLEYTDTQIELQRSESKALLDDDTLLKKFATSLASLLEARETAGLAVLPSAPCLSTAGHASRSPGTLQQNSPEMWFRQPSLVFSVLAFLPAEEIFMAVENVCRAWQGWLFMPDMSRFFWVGCVQREFPQQLQVLLQTVGDDLYQCDWRSLAMLCVTEVERTREKWEEADEASGGGCVLPLLPQQRVPACSGDGAA
ncbi:hypothetical protein Q4I32_003335 [Leishmania shawi]|uniref:F-box domain-containing protein n=1 Tax=Leishmania shawi TaxID=5680 RepID=A0AAW3BZA5_9TRYP